MFRKIFNKKREVRPLDKYIREFESGRLPFAYNTSDYALYLREWSQYLGNKGIVDLTEDDYVDYYDIKYSIPRTVTGKEV